MKLLGFISTAVLSLTLGAAVPVCAQEQHEQQEEKKEKPAAQKERKTQADKPAMHEERTPPHQDKNGKREEKTAERQDKNTSREEQAARQEHKNASHEEQTAHSQQQQRDSHARAVQPGHSGGGRIPDDRFRAHFGHEHRFHVTEANYRQDRRFQYGGYWFGFVDPWPTNWLYTQDVFVIEIDGVYYLCNPAYPGVNVALSVTL